MVALSTSHWPGKKWKEKTEGDTDSSPNWKGSVLSFKKKKRRCLKTKDPQISLWALLNKLSNEIKYMLSLKGEEGH